MRGSRGEQIVQSPHARGESRFREDPAATEAAKPVHLGKAVGHDEMVTEVKGWARRLVKYCFQVNLIGQHSRADAARDLSHGTEARRIGESSARIVKIGDDHQAGAGGDVPGDFLRIKPEILLKAARKAANDGSQITGRAGHGMVVSGGA